MKLLKRLTPYSTTINILGYPADGQQKMVKIRHLKYGIIARANVYIGHGVFVKDY